MLESCEERAMLATITVNANPIVSEDFTAEVWVEATDVMFPVTIDWGTANGSGSAGDDYVASSGGWTFNSDGMQSFYVTTLNVDGDQNFFVNIDVDAMAYTTVGITITDDDGSGSSGSAPEFVDPSGSTPVSSYTFEVGATAGAETIDWVYATDADGDPLTYDGNPTSPFSVSNDGGVDYDGTGPISVGESYSFDATVDDGNGGSDIATVTVNVVDLNNAPVAVDDGFHADVGATMAASVLDNDWDMDGDMLTATSLSDPFYAEIFTFNPDGTFTYKPLPGWGGSDSFQYEVTDGHKTATANVFLQATGTPRITVKSVSKLPNMRPGAFEGGQGGEHVFEIIVSGMTATSPNVTYKYKTSGGDPVNDYYPKALTQRVFTEDGTHTITVISKSDTEVEGDETFQFVIQDIVGATAIETAATGIIRDNDVRVIVPTEATIKRGKKFYNTGLKFLGHKTAIANGLQIRLHGFTDEIFGTASSPQDYADVDVSTTSDTPIIITPSNGIQTTATATIGDEIYFLIEAGAGNTAQLLFDQPMWPGLTDAPIKIKITAP